MQSYQPVNGWMEFVKLDVSAFFTKSYGFDLSTFFFKYQTGLSGHSNFKEKTVKLPTEKV